MFEIKLGHYPGARQHVLCREAKPYNENEHP